MPAEITWNEQTVDVSSLKPYERNPRRINKKAFDTLKQSLQQNGYHQRIIATPDYRVIGGHQRIRALQELGIKQVQILVPDRELSDLDFKRLLIQDNLPFGEFDFDMLASDFELDDLENWGMPADWLGKLPSPDFDDEAADAETALQAKVISTAGDLWQLGNHRLLCGDSTVATDVEKVLGGIKPNLMVTDPPYGVEYDANWRNKALRADGTPIAGRAVGKVQNDDKADWREAWALFPGNIAYVWHAGLFSGTVAESLVACDFKLRSQIVWAKSNFAIGRGDYHWGHEPCWYAVKTKGDWHGDRKQSTLWQIDKPQKSETGHSTQKPVECMRRPMQNNSSEGQAVYEPFSGSGTTIIAGEQTGRHVLAIELNPAYVDMAVRRWQTFTGQEAKAEDGRTFSEIENGLAKG